MPAAVIAPSENDKKYNTTGPPISMRTIGIAFVCLLVSFGALFGILVGTGAFAKKAGPQTAKGYCTLTPDVACTAKCLAYSTKSVATNKQADATVPTICVSNGFEPLMSGVIFQDDQNSTAYDRCAIGVSSVKKATNAGNGTFIDEANTCIGTNAGTCNSCLSSAQLQYNAIASMPAPNYFPCTYLKEADKSAVCSN